MKVSQDRTEQKNPGGFVSLAPSTSNGLRWEAGHVNFGRVSLGTEEYPRVGVGSGLYFMYSSIS